jgi:hypothetical protein
VREHRQPFLGKCPRIILLFAGDDVELRDRIGDLLSAHFEHQELGASAAYERETGKVEFAHPPNTRTFDKALFNGEHFPIQAGLYLAHRARLYIIEALVDYWLACERGEIKKPVPKVTTTSSRT